MKRTKLPPNWVVATSTTYPDKVYYFNVSTNKSSWIHPSDPNISTEEPPPKLSKTANKRKKPDDHGDSAGARPFSPEPDDLPLDERPKLKARRQLAPREDEENGESTDTPQMRALREKMRLRQAQGNAVKKPKIIKSPEIKDSPNRTKKKKLAGQAEASEDPSEVKGMTPQMRVLQEKIKARKSLGASTSRKSKIMPKPNDEGREKMLTRISRARSMSVSSAASEPPSVDLCNRTESPAKKPAHRKSRSIMIDENVKRIRTVDAPPGVSSKRIFVDKDEDAGESSSSSTTTVFEPRSPQKNTVQDRIYNLRKSLVPEEKNEASTSTTQQRVRKKPLSATIVDPMIFLRKESLPNVYKNAEARLKSLRQRLSTESEIAVGKRRATLFETSPRSPREPDSTLETIIDATEPCYEEMEWEPIEEERIVFEIQSVRAQLGTADDSPLEIQMREVPTNPLTLDVADGAKSDRRVLYIVIDTNVFLTSLQSVEIARDAVFKRYGRPLIVVPWTVIRELDFIKDDKSKNRPESLKAKARQAIRFLHQHFSAKHPRVLGQTPLDVIKNKQEYQISCPDDEILQTCLQIRSSRNSVVLLTYDTNLCNKAMIQDVVTLGRMDPLEKIDFLEESECRHESMLSVTLRVTGDDPQEAESPLSKELALAEDLFEETTSMLTSFMTVIIAKEMKNLFGDNWERYAIVQPPWTAVTVLKCGIKHWIAAVSESFIKNAEAIIKDLHQVIIKWQYNRRLKDVGELIERCFDLIQCLRTDKYPNMLTKFTIAIEDLKKKYVEATKQCQENELRDRIGPERNEVEQETRAIAAFRCFENVYAFARDLCGTAAETMGMPCTFQYKKIDSLPAIEDLKNLRPEIAANLNRLLQVLSTAFDDINEIHVNHRSVNALYHALVNFLPEIGEEIHEELSPTDVYWCLKRKVHQLRLGLGQLQELSSHFCRMASFKAT